MLIFAPKYDGWIGHMLIEEPKEKKKSLMRINLFHLLVPHTEETYIQSQLCWSLYLYNITAYLTLLKRKYASHMCQACYKCNQF